MLARVVSAILLAVLLTAGSWHPAATNGTPKLYLVVIVVDGFRPDYETLVPMRHLRALMAAGRSYDTAWVGHMESETPPGHATIATGVYPAKHHVSGFGWRDPATGQFTWAPTDLKAIAQGYITRTMEQSGVPTISDLIHQRNRSDLSISISGEKLWAAAPLGAGADYILYGKEVPYKKTQVRFRPQVVGPNLPPRSSGYLSVEATDSAFTNQDGFAARLAAKLVTALRPRALLLNLPGTDLAGHYYGGMNDPKDMRDTLKAADYAIGTVVNTYKKLGLYSKTLFVITADHGMADNRTIVPIHKMYNLIRTLPVTQLDQEYRISVGSIWLRDPQNAATVASHMTAQHYRGIDGALYKVSDTTGMRFVPDAWTRTHVPAALLKAYIDLANTEASPAGPDILLPYGEDTTGLPPGHKYQGSHGGFSWGVQHIPLVLVGPGIRPGLSHFPAKLVDVAPTIERLLGLPVPAGVDGVVLADAMRNAQSADSSAQTGVAAGRLADVQALRAHSLAQTAAHRR
ncbi:MAG TPA: alkaline phosphatase family protein [Chloroflexota bacterium]